MEMQSSNENINVSNHQKTNNQSDDSKYVWYLLSLLSWIIFFFTLWYSFRTNRFIWTSFTQYFFDILYLVYFPINLNSYLVNLFLFVLGLTAFIIYLFFTIYKRNQDLYEGMLDQWSKFHFIPLLLISSLFIIGNFDYSSGSETELKYNKMLMIFDIIFTIIALISLVFIYIKTELNCEWYIVITIKKGLFSTLIILLLYNFFKVIICLKSADYRLADNSDLDSLYSFYKGIGIAFTIIMGVITLGFSFFFKDIMAAFTTFLIYVGLIRTFFSYLNEYEKNFKKELIGYTEGVLDIILMLISIALIGFLIFKYNQFLA